MGALSGPGCLATDDDESGSDPDSGRIRVDAGLTDLIPGSPDEDTGQSGGDADLSDAPGGELWAVWGTTGSLDGLAKSPDGYALCGLDDIRTDDLGARLDETVPETGWDSRPVSDEPGFCGDDLETTAWRLMNCERLSRDIDPLQCDLRLVWLGRQHSLDMVARGYFDHEDPDGVGPEGRLTARGVDFSWMGENIAQYPGVESAHHGWMDSQEGHRENILFDRFSHAGIGIVGASYGYMLTQDFIQE
jgi:hypothetical protein